MNVGIFENIREIIAGKSVSSAKKPERAPKCVPKQK
jgi:hypothetical protein